MTDTEAKLNELSETKSTLKNKIKASHEKRLKEFEIQGRNDGQMNLPALDDLRPSETEFEIKNRYDSDINYLEEEGRPRIDEPHEDYMTSTDELENISKKFDQIKKEEMERITENKDRQQEEAKKNHDFEIENIEDQKKDIHGGFHIEGKKWRDVTERIGRSQPIIYLKPAWLEWTILIFLGLCEIPLNYTVFANFLLPNIETYILSCLLVIAIPIIAHHTGICFRQYEENRKYIAHLLVIVPFMLGLNIAVAILRSNYIFQVLKVTINIWNTLTFLGLSIILFIVGIIVSFLHHDKSQELVETYNIYNKAKAEYESEIKSLNSQENKTDKEYGTLIKNIEAEFEREKVIIENLVSNLKQKIKDAVVIYDNILSTFRALERAVNSNYKICISRYRSANHRARKNKMRPKSWGEIESLKFVFHDIEELDKN